MRGDGVAGLGFSEVKESEMDNAAVRLAEGIVQRWSVTDFDHDKGVITRYMCWFCGAHHYPMKGESVRDITLGMGHNAWCVVPEALAIHEVRHTHKISR